MANTKSQEKRNRKNEKWRQRNTQVQSSIRTNVKKIEKILGTKEQASGTALNDSMNSFFACIDSAAHKGIVHKNTAARKKARMAKKVNNALKQLA